MHFLRANWTRVLCGVVAAILLLTWMMEWTSALPLTEDTFDGYVNLFVGIAFLVLAFMVNGPKRR